MSIEIDLARLHARLRHLMLAERLGGTGARYKHTGRPLVFTARSMRAVFGRAHLIEDPELHALSSWSHIPTEPTEFAHLGLPFDEPIVRDDTEHLLRRLEYLFFEEDLRVEVAGAWAMLDLRRRPPLEVCDAYLHCPDNPVRRAVVRTSCGSPASSWTAPS